MSLFQPRDRGFEQGPSNGGFGGGSEPDWQALAESHEAQQRRKRRLAVIGGALGVALVLGGVAALATVGSGSSKANASGTSGSSLGTGPNGGNASGAASGTASPGASGSASASASTGPSASSSSSASSSASASASGKASGKALPPLWPALNAGAVLYAQQLGVDGRLYVRKLTDEKSPCWMATTGHLGNALAPNRCSQVLRATWVSGDQAVSVGVAVLPDAAAAEAANAAYVGHIEPLRGPGIPSFCQDQTPCALAHGVVGHFTYYVIAGPSGSAPGVNNAASVAAAQRMAAFAVSALERQH